MNELVECVPGVLAPSSVGKAEHDLRPLSHDETFPQFVYGPPHELGTDVIVLRRSYKQIVGIQADSTYGGWVDGNLTRLPPLREYRFPIVQISVYLDL